MRFSQVVVVAAASFLFASEAIAVTVDTNQGKISTVARGGPSQRLLRSYKAAEDDSDDLDDLDDLEDLDDSEERGGNSALKDLAKSWNLSYSGIKSGAIKLTEEQHNAWKAIINARIDAGTKAKRDAYNAAWRKENGIGRRV
ncbi:Avirulence (Avh) protein [Phytophthora megakarya]|uniref:RxLR effector protein n=1 Tax=Phytophthora megakarya TaxID=4795 RepID=A0A225VUR0_9STRA|nr:Avirulence (Avh) protein [Phytophthora megakarya]